VLRVLLYALCYAPLVWLVWQIYAVTQGAAALGANPIEAIIRRLGEIALIFLAITLSVSPLKAAFNLPWVLQYRRLLGVTTFVYATLHLLAYAAWDQAFSLPDIVLDTAKRPFILVGMVSWLLLLPLALTSTHAAIRWLGGRRWQLLHRAVYAIALLSCAHYVWMKAAKNNLDRPAVYVGLFLLLLAWRVYRYCKRRAVR
jgi:sulfoxide reductase heme-binding subunit YedZ